MPAILRPHSGVSLSGLLGGSVTYRSGTHASKPHPQEIIFCGFSLATSIHHLTPARADILRDQRHWAGKHSSKSRLHSEAFCRI
jgi:hypothetical protein